MLSPAGRYWGSSSNGVKAFIYQNLTIGKEKLNKPQFLKLIVKYSKTNPDGIGAKLFLKTTKGVDHQEIQTSNAFQSNQDLNKLFTLSLNEKPVKLLIIWPNNSWQVIEKFNIGASESIAYDSNGEMIARTSHVFHHDSGIGNSLLDEIFDKLKHILSILLKQMRLQKI